MEIQTLPDKMIDIKKIEFNQDRLYILGENGDLWGMGSNSNFRLKSHMDEHLKTLELVNLEMERHKGQSLPKLSTGDRSYEGSQSDQKQFSRSQSINEFRSPEN